ncbi:hypothetical protein Psuf_044250 [Phytohabitans suffuscus]|uniref:Transcription regulator PadR N-terminal domain-containing protein n=1 Tax=Phytohabitans suffuscus TaxID=624315 RepID=A0A6F8YLX2_9ACTN|nr:hypothetical protein Psuf_044250 [Phytohabitans suffuscus]
METEGLVSHTAAGGRKVYEITDAGRAELRQRAGELDVLESDIRASVEDLASLANEIQDEVRGSVRDLKRELNQATRETRRGGRDFQWEFQWGGPGSSTRGEPASGTALDELEKRIDAFAAEVRQLVRGARLTEGQARTATRVLDASLATLRRLFRS